MPRPAPPRPLPAPAPTAAPAPVMRRLPWTPRAPRGRRRAPAPRRPRAHRRERLRRPGRRGASLVRARRRRRTRRAAPRAWAPWPARRASWPTRSPRRAGCLFLYIILGCRGRHAHVNPLHIHWVPRSKLLCVRQLLRAAALPGTHVHLSTAACVPLGAAARAPPGTARTWGFVRVEAALGATRWAGGGARGDRGGAHVPGRRRAAAAGRGRRRAAGHRDHARRAGALRRGRGAVLRVWRRARRPAAVGCLDWRPCACQQPPLTQTHACLLSHTPRLLQP